MSHPACCLPLLKCVPLFDRRRMQLRTSQHKWQRPSALQLCTGQSSSGRRQVRGFCEPCRSSSGSNHRCNPPAELQRESRTKDANLSALREAISLFDKRLGLRFERGDGALRQLPTHQLCFKLLTANTPASRARSFYGFIVLHLLIRRLAPPEIHLLQHRPLQSGEGIHLRHAELRVRARRIHGCADSGWRICRVPLPTRTLLLGSGRLLQHLHIVAYCVPSQLLTSSQRHRL